MTFKFAIGSRAAPLGRARGRRLRRTDTPAVPVTGRPGAAPAGNRD